MKKRSHSFGRKLKLAREAAGMTQAQLAKRCRMHFTAVSQYESGRQEPTLTNALRLAKGVGKKLDEII